MKVKSIFFILLPIPARGNHFHIYWKASSFSLLYSCLWEPFLCQIDITFFFHFSSFLANGSHVSVQWSERFLSFFVYSFVWRQVFLLMESIFFDISPIPASGNHFYIFWQVTISSCSGKHFFHFLLTSTSWNHFYVK